jgi:thiamine-phosphate pyrophosphorylase
LHDNNKITSVSAHTLEEIKTHCMNNNHVIVSPVFPSISKENHVVKWDKVALQDELIKYQNQTTIYAVGGIDVTTIIEAKKMGFLHFGLLGALWKNPVTAVESFRKIKNNVLL